MYIHEALMFRVFGEILLDFLGIYVTNVCDLMKNLDVKLKDLEVILKANKKGKLFVQVWN